MERLVVLLLLFFYSANCHEKRGIVESKYPFHNKPQQPIQKDTHLLSFPSNYNLNPEFPNVDTSQYLQTNAQNPYSQYVLPYNNQYVNQPIQNLYVPYNQFQHLMGQLNTDFTKNIPVSQPIGPKVGEVRTVGYQTQVYHPLHTNIHDNRPQVFQQQYQPRLPQQLPQRLPQQLPQQRRPPPQKQSPPTPPKIYRNFRPILPQNPAPVREVVNPNQHQIPVHHPKNDHRNLSENEEQNESNEEINEENEQQNEDQENEDQRNEEQENEDQQNEDQQEDEKEEINESDEKENIENESEEREQFEPNRFFGNFKDDHQKFLQEDDHKKEDHEDSESRTKYATKYKKSNNKRPNYKKYFPEPFKHDTDFDTFTGFTEPKVEIKMYKYSKSSKKPERREYLDGKESRNVPVIQHSQKSYKESWIISKSETSD